MKNILLPTDFSENSKNAIHYALEFFKGNTCTFYFLNTQKVSEYTTSNLYTATEGNTVYDAILKDNKQELHSFVDQYEKEYAREKFTFISIIDFDVFTDAVNQAVNAYDIDLIIMGSNGATGAKEVVFGSNTLKVIRNVDCPLLVIPEGYHLTKVEIVLFTIHNHESIDVIKLKPLLEIINQRHALLKVLEINDKEIDIDIENKFQKQLKENFKNIKTEFYKITGVSTPIAIDSFTQLIDVNMHASFFEKESFIKRFVYGSEMAKIDYGTKVPLLILHK